MSTRDHSAIEELLSVRALGALDGQDELNLAREMASHGDCDRCRHLQLGFNEVAGRLGLSLEPVAVDPEMASRIIAASGDGARDEAATDEVTARRERRRGLGAAVAVAAAFALLVGGFAVVKGGKSVDVAAVSPAQRFVPFTLAPDTSGRLALAYTPGQQGAVLVGLGLADPGPGKVYELWTIAGTTVVSGGCVTPTNGSLSASVHPTVDRPGTLAVTTELSSCPDAPTSTPFATATLTA